MNKGFIRLKIGQLTKADWNYKNDNDMILRKLVENIRRNGQVENLIVREIGEDQYEVINGNHRIDAMQLIGIDEVMCFNLGKISINDAKRIAIETNETKFETNEVLLSGLINEIVQEYSIEELRMTMPYDDEQLDDILKLIHFNPDDYDNTVLENDEEKQPTMIKCPNCGYEWEK